MIQAFVKKISYAYYHTDQASLNSLFLKKYVISFYKIDVFPLYKYSNIDAYNWDI